jgi:hypothetical protein
LVICLFSQFKSPQITGATAQERIAKIRASADQNTPADGDAIAAAAGDADASVRQAVMAALAGYPADKYRPVIANALKDPAENVRAAAAYTFGMYHDRPAADRLGEVLNTDASPAVRLAAVRGLDRNGDLRAVVVLFRVIEKPGNAEIRKQAYTSILHTLHFYITHIPEPDTAEWNDQVNVLRRVKVIRRAFESAGDESAGNGDKS